MNLVDFLITYLAIGAAFAMRVYFSSRHRRKLFILRSVLFELAFWLPKWVIWSIRKIASGPSAKNPGAERDREEIWYVTHVDALVHSFPSYADQKRFRETAERYAALRTGLSTSESEHHIEGQFELFEISGHLNGRTGTSCLYRKNLAKLRQHSLRSAKDLVRLAMDVPIESPTFDARSKAIEFFSAFDDADAVKVAENFEVPFTGGTVSLNCANQIIAAKTAN